MNLGRRSARNEDPEINVVSFIDILLLLLIFFMLTTRFVDETRIQLRLPDASASDAVTPKQNAVEISITAAGGMALNGKELVNNAPETLSAAIIKAVGEERELPVLIRADARASHQSVVTAMDVAGRLGFKAVNIATINQPASVQSNSVSAP